MRRDDVNELATAILVVVTAVLFAHGIWMHVKCAALESEVAALSEKLELHINPPPEPTFCDKAKQTYDKVKSAAVKGYQAAMEELEK